MKNLAYPGITDRLWQYLIKRVNLSPDMPACNVSQGKIALFAGIMKKMDFSITGFSGFNRAMITCGGVDCSQVEPSTMRSRLVDNLFFAGEVLDLDGPTGGYNLQVCWTTGYTAGCSAAV